MTYSEIIQKNCENSSVVWWPRYAYHYTDILNAVSILSSGKLYSRMQALSQEAMKNDNASRQVIDVTENEIYSFVRFYFRPLTPTQFHNEGFKHPSIRYARGQNANVPVPVFLLFDLDKLLNLRETRFSEFSQAGHGSAQLCGTEAFSNLDFGKIYSTGSAGNEVMKYRHAELLYPKELEISEFLRIILCRNECERASLLNFLRLTNGKAFYKYKERIKVASENTFYRNGLYVEAITYHQDCLSIVFSDSIAKKQYVDWQSRRGVMLTSSKIEARIKLQWRNSKEIIRTVVLDVDIDYMNHRVLSLNNLPRIANAQTLTAILFLEKSCVCLFSQTLSSSELL